MASIFRNALSFFEELGVFDVILPFLLIFTIVYGILEKTKILGTLKVNKVESSQKGLNAIVAFVVGLLFVGSTKLVDVLLGSIAKFVVLLMLPILFLILVGAFHTGGDEFKLGDKWQKFFYIILFIGIALIFLGQFGWLDVAYTWILSNWDTTVFSSILFLLIIVGGIFLVVKEPSKKPDKKKKDD